MWSRRKKEVVSDDDAELRALANAYAQLHDRNKPTSSSDEIQSSQTPQTPSFEPLVSTPANMDAVPELPQNDMIQGNSISYTRAEAKLYANEEPCDSWRHFDVIPRNLHIYIRNGSIIICHYTWARISIGTVNVDLPYHTGMTSDSVSARKV
jgi:hypothetical protein